MKRVVPWRVLLALFVLARPGLTGAEQPQPQERQFPFPVAAVQTALQQLGAYRGARLPTLSGFIVTERAEIPNYERPYYEFKLDLKPQGPSQTLVRVQANVSAWYADPQGSNSGYQKFESNGRLEADLLDRLNNFLTNNKSTLTLDVEQQIEVIRKQRMDAERRVTELEKKLQEAKASGNELAGKEYLAVARAHVPILRAPDSRASILLRAEPEDEFEVLEHRGAWTQVRLEGEHSGWIRNSLAKADGLASSNGSSGATSSIIPAFTVVREIISQFSGEWARLRDKQALYVWARPEGSALNAVSGEKLHFAKKIFMERYREAAHNSRNSVEGIVVIFLDQRGGVAAASLDDIHFWAEGSLSSAAFIKKCSLDPPGAFGNLAATGRAANP